MTLKDSLVTTTSTTTTTTTTTTKAKDNDNLKPQILLLDGGVSTHLRDLWQQDFAYPQLWSSSLLLTPLGRDTILQGHKDWLRAGSNILTTVTYQCHIITNTSSSDDDDDGLVIDKQQLDQMLQDGVQLAQRAVAEEAQSNTTTSQPHYVVASMGCYGAALADGSEYTGNYPLIQCQEDLTEFHKAKFQTLLQQHPDGIALETVPCVMECRAFVSLLQQQLATSKEETTNAAATSAGSCAFWLSLACRNDAQLNDGSPIEDALQAIDELDPQAQLVHAIGINCCDSQYVVSLAKKIVTFLAHKTIQQQQQQQQSTTTAACRGIAIYPNSGEEWNPETKTWNEGTGLRAEELQDVFATRLLETVDIIHQTWNDIHSKHNHANACPPPPTILLGGCCRTRPATIRALRTLVDQRQTQQHQPHGGKKESEMPSSSSSPPAGALTPDQQRMLDQIMKRDADLDRQLGDLGNDLQDLCDIGQQQGDATDRHSYILEKAKDKAPTK